MQTTGFEEGKGRRCFRPLIRRLGRACCTCRNSRSVGREVGVDVFWFFGTKGQHGVVYGRVCFRALI